MNTDKKIALSLFFMRITIFLVMFMWTMDKFFRPEHIAAIFEKFYFIPGVSVNIAYGLGIAEMMVITCFVLGLAKRWTYGFVLVVHAASTFSPLMQYFSPFEGNHLLFFAAWPMLAACFALFVLRDKDTLLSLNRPRPIA